MSLSYHYCLLKASRFGHCEKWKVKENILIPLDNIVTLGKSKKNDISDVGKT